jgi:uncharacterized protein (DUF1501 family)
VEVIMWNRRVFLRNGGLALVAMGTIPRFLQRSVSAAEAAPAARPVLVTIFQRGAMDGLMAVPPLTGNHLGRLRPTLAMSALRSAGDASLIDLGCDFGLHPAMAELEPLWSSGELAIVHGVGSPHATRSHFDAQDFMETGTPGRKATPSGWLNRATAALGDDASPLRAVALDRSLPRSLRGPTPAVAVEDLDEFSLATPERSLAAYLRGSSELLHRQALATDEALALMDEVRRASRTRPRRYPDSQLGRSLAQIACLVRADVGLEIACADCEGWDTHTGQGTANGAFARSARDLSSSVAAFWDDLGQHQSSVVVLTMTEFGRTVAENGSGGTDHGHGSVLFVLGSAVEGGRVHGAFPGLEPEQLYQRRDLAVTTDFRSVFSEVAAAHLKIEDPTALFPGWSGQPIPLFQPT